MLKHKNFSSIVKLSLGTIIMMSLSGCYLKFGTHKRPIIVQPQQPQQTQPATIIVNQTPPTTTPSVSTTPSTPTTSTIPNTPTIQPQNTPQPVVHQPQPTNSELGERSLKPINR